MIPVQNVYYMLSYAFKVLNEQGYKRIATEEYNNTAELMAAILAKGIAVQLKRGLGKEYISQTEDLSSLRGKIDIAESIKTQSMLRKKLICTYDDFSVNSTMNRIIKSTVELALEMLLEISLLQNMLDMPAVRQQLSQCHLSQQQLLQQLFIKDSNYGRCNERYDLGSYDSVHLISNRCLSGTY